MLYVYRSAVSEGADILVEDICLQGTRARRTRGRLLNNLQAGDAVVCWGAKLPVAVPAGVKVINNVEPVSKFTEAQRLTAAGVSTVQVSRTRPVVQPVAPEPFVEPLFTISGRQVRLAELHAALVAIQRDAESFTARRDVAFRAHQLAQQQRALVVQSDWLPRRNNHVGGADLLTPPANPDFYSKKENIVEEYRLHMFKGKSIRAGKKVARPTRPDGRTPPHQWIRSYDAGWVIEYAGFRSNEAMRQLASSALTALGLEFGAVDMGKRADGSLLVLEVNRAPGVEGGTSEAYARHIISWLQGN